MVKQTVRSEAEKEAIKERKGKIGKKPKQTSGKRRGRKKGSLNKNRSELDLSPELLRISGILSVLLKLLRVFVRVKYLAMDGHFGHHQAVLMAQSNGLELISKLRKDAAIYEKYEGEYRGRGAKKK